VLTQLEIKRRGMCLEKNVIILQVDAHTTQPWFSVLRMLGFEIATSPVMLREESSLFSSMAFSSDLTSNALP
jgi:hypothetical protein